METWQDKWDEAADDERKRMEARTAAELLADVSEGRFGNYYVIWYVIASKSTVDEAGWTLFKTLVGEADYLYRYHCAAALLQLMGEATMKPVDLSADHPGIKSALAALRLRLTGMIGESPAICQNTSAEETN
ncbi:MAG: hypothetical protein R6V62_08275 [Candidatus Fermentibacteraceae bacterium]